MDTPILTPDEEKLLRREALRKAQKARRKRLAEAGFKSVSIFLPQEHVAKMDLLVQKGKFIGRAEVIMRALDELDTN